MEIDLRPVERAVALVQLVLETAALESRLQSGLGEVPFLVGAELVVRTSRELELVLEPEQLVEVGREVETAEDLVFDLLAGAEEVRVVLGHVPHPGQTVQGSRELVAVERPGLGET